MRWRWGLPVFQPEARGHRIKPQDGSVLLIAEQIDQLCCGEHSARAEPSTMNKNNAFLPCGAA